MFMIKTIFPVYRGQRSIRLNIKDFLSGGFGTKVKQEQPILPAEETVILEKGILGIKVQKVCNVQCFFLVL